MAKQHSHRNEPEYAAGESRAEWLLRWQTLVTLAVTALCMGGMVPWMPWPLLGMSLVSLLPLLMARAEGRTVRWSRLLPAALWVVYVGASLLNPSHERALDGSWKPLAGWISWLPTTMDRAYTLHDAAPFLAALIQGGSLAALRRGRRAQNRLLLSLVIFTLALTLFGIVALSGGSNVIAWVHKVKGGQCFATFVYKNHWVAFSAPVALTAAALGLGYWDRGGNDSRARHLALFALGACVLILASYPLTVSRSGTLVAGLVVLVLLVAMLRRGLQGVRTQDSGDRSGEAGAGEEEPWVEGPRFTRRKVLTGAERARRVRVWLFGAGASFALTVVGVLLYANWPALEKNWDRVEREYTATTEKGEWNLRVYAARDTARMALDRPVFGWGGGSFFPVFSLYQGDYGRHPKTGKIVIKFEDAHCDWVQLWAEYGAVGLLLLVVPAIAALVRTWRVGGVRSRWIFWGLVIILVYAVGEFPFQNLAALMVWAVLATVISTPRREGRRR